MEKVYLSDAGPKVSPVIYGFYRWGTEDVTEEKMEAIVRLCLDLGINTFDHADIYGGYQCEELFGRVIKKLGIKRKDIILFTKCGLTLPHASRPEVRVPHYDTSSEHIIKSLDNSLRHLSTGYVDVFLLNGLDVLSNLEETALTLQSLKDSGKIKNIGLVNFSVFQHQLLSAYLKAPIVTNHVELSLLNTQSFDNGQIDYLKQRYMRPLATSPLAEGQIATGNSVQALRLRQVLEPLAHQYHTDIESIAVAWLIKLGALPLIGTTNEQRIRNAAGAYTIQLDRQDWYALYNAAIGKG
jgi:predicted oxidoreductase